MEIPNRPDVTKTEQPPTAEAAADRAARVERAAEVWRGQLVDLGGRNTLLYYKDLRQGTLDIGPGSGADQLAVASLLGAQTVRLSTLFAGADQLAPAAKRARTVSAKARAMFEERGLRTLYLAWGMATWTNTKSMAAPAAPILMASIVLASRGAAGEDFDLSLTDDVEVNPTLLHLLEADFSIALDAEDLADLLGDDAVGAPDPTPVFDRITKECAELAGFRIDPRVVIGNFSYAKLPMVKDLESALDELAAHDLVAALAGDASAQKALRDRHVTVTLADPDRVPLKDEFLILDTDASQNYAINAVLADKDLVIDGPPGTGKSQTIANLIASLVAHGKKVLFVAEKRAAIDAVLGRLQRVGLGDLVLDLHDGVGNRRKLAEELARALASAATITAPDLSALPAQEKRRERLVAHDTAMHGRLYPWGLSVYDAQAGFIAAPAHLRSAFRLDGTRVRALDAETALAARDAIVEFTELGGPGLDHGRTSSAWARAITLGTIASSDTVTNAFKLVRRLDGEGIPDLIRDLNAAAEAAGVRPAGSLAAWNQVVDLWSRVRLTEARFNPDLHYASLPALVTDMAPAAKGTLARAWAHLLWDARYRKAKTELQALARSEMTPKELLAAVTAAKQEAEDWEHHREGESFPSAPEELDTLAQRLARTEAELDTLAAWIGVPIRDLTAGELLDLLADLRDQNDVLKALPRLTSLHRRLEAAGLGPLVKEIGVRDLGAEDAPVVFDHVWFGSILESVSMTDPYVATFRRDALDKVARDFTAGDHAHLDTTPRRVLRAVAEGAVQARSDHPEEEQVVLKQSKLKRRHLPARDLFQAAPNVLTAMKPCWAMSPLVVSHVLPAQAGLFDVVVFDEASQIQPADAVGSLLRGRHAVVAGDPRQLPPTTFFLPGDGDGAGEGDGDGGPLTTDLESVLDAMTVLLPPPEGTRTLRWHYRSRDERLITFSNAQPSLYDWSLTTFPGVTGDGGLRHVLVPFDAGTAGQEQSAAREVAAVVDLILEHARIRPHESLGVIAMGIAHAERVTEALRRARFVDPDLDAFFDEGAEESFFVKNLERVQGDERDAIVLTIGYGKTADGRLLYRFGPINQQGGERRLNVAITRARTRMTVVSSFGADEMDPAKLRSEGPQMLQRFLRYAESGGADLGHLAKDRPALNPFERDVRQALTAAGIPLVPQVGSSGYWIDFAAEHPKRPGQMVLAIETDGAMYHSSPTARDRDRLRQEHLERLGWSFHRIWSTSWSNDREREIALAVQAYEAAVRRADGEAPDLAEARAAQATPSDKAPARGPRPNVPPGLSIGDYTHRQLVSIVRWIESDTLLRTDDELLEAVMAELRFKRRGTRIVRMINEAIAEVRGDEA